MQVMIVAGDTLGGRKGGSTDILTVTSLNRLSCHLVNDHDIHAGNAVSNADPIKSDQVFLVWLSSIILFDICCAYTELFRPAWVYLGFYIHSSNEMTDTIPDLS